MSFSVSADAYDRFMGRYSVRLGPQLAEFAGVRAGQPVDRCRLRTRRAHERAGRSARLDQCVRGRSIGAFVAAARERFAAVDARRAAAEQLPFPDNAFDAALEQLVVHFMSDPVAGLREMARVMRHDGVVAACVWDHAGDQGPLSVFWRAARELDPDVTDESQLAGARDGHLAELFVTAGLRGVEATALVAAVVHASFEDRWGPFTLGVGPAGAYAAGLEAIAERSSGNAARRCSRARPSHRPDGR